METQYHNEMLRERGMYIAWAGGLTFRIVDMRDGDDLEATTYEGASAPDANEALAFATDLAAQIAHGDLVSFEDLVQLVECWSTATDGKPPWDDEVEWHGGSWSVTLSYDDRYLTIPYFTGAKAFAPKTVDVLDTLMSDVAMAHAGSFEDFCSDYGYDIDSRRAYAMWEGCVKEAIQVEHLLGDDLARFQRAHEAYARGLRGDD